jgi:hypothetical protein
MEAPQATATIDTNELAKLEKESEKEDEEEELSVNKDFVVSVLPDDLVWKAKQAMFDTRLDDCESMVKPFASANLVSTPYFFPSPFFCLFKCFSGQWRCMRKPLCGGSCLSMVQMVFLLFAQDG